MLLAKAMTKRRFRIAVVLPAVLTALAVVASCVGETSLPPPLQEHLRQQRNAEFAVVDWVLVALALPLLAAYIAAFVGLLKFRPHSRSLNLVMSAVGLIALPLAGPTVETGITTSLLHASSMLYGAVLAIAYQRPVADWFQDRPPTEATRTGRQ